MSDSKATNARGGADSKPALDSAWTAAAVLMGSIVPGGGHLLLGQTFKAILFALALLATMAIGLYKGQYANFTEQAQERHPVMYVLQYFTGGPALVAHSVTPEAAEMSPAFQEPKQFEIAVLFTAVAGLLNLLVLMNLIGLPQRLRIEAQEQKKKRDERSKQTERGPPPPATEEEKPKQAEESPPGADKNEVKDDDDAAAEDREASERS